MRPIALLPAAALALTGATSGPAVSDDDAAIVSLAPISVPITDSGRVQGSLEAKLAVRGADGDALAGQLPVLRAAMVSELGEFARLHASPYAPVDAAALSAALSAAATRAVPQAQGMLILQVAARPA